jgi:hypothetical protein
MLFTRSVLAGFVLSIVEIDFVGAARRSPDHAANSLLEGSDLSTISKGREACR